MRDIPEAQVCKIDAEKNAMISDAEEVPLTGGNVNSVVRKGDTVRRQLTPQSKTVHEFLVHLERTQVPASRFLGVDSQGREILSFIEGETDFPDDIWNSDTWLTKSARLLRQFHDASTEFVPTEPAHWAFEYPDTNQHEVINHNDFAPYNMVFTPDGAISIIDIDLCGPGPRVRDLAYLAYWMAPLSFSSDPIHKFPNGSLEHVASRVNTLCRAYEYEDSKRLLSMVSEVLNHMANETIAIAMLGEKAAMSLKAGGNFARWACEAAAFDEQREELAALMA